MNIFALKKEIDDLKRRNEELEAENAELRAKATELCHIITYTQEQMNHRGLHLVRESDD